MVGGVRWWPAPGVEPDRLRALAERALSADVPAQKRGRRKSAYLLTLASGTPDLLLKVNEYAALPPWRRLGASKARHELACAARLAAAGVATPQPLAAGELRRGPLLVRCFELVPWLLDAIDLARFRADPSRSPVERRACAQALGSTVRAIHAAGVDQDDLAPNNFLWRPHAAQPLLAVDFERARLRARVSWRARRLALAKLDRYCAGASAAARMRVLRAYCPRDRATLHGAWRAIEASAVVLLGRDARRWASAATKSTRRFEPLPIDPEGRRRGFLRRGVDRSASCAALGGSASPDWLVQTSEARGSREARRWFGLALALHQRGLALRPDACAFGDGSLRIAFERPAGVARLDASSAREARAALVVGLDRLLALGSLGDRIARDAFAVTSTRDRVWLVDASALRLGGAWLRPGRRAEARRLASGVAS